MVEKMYKISKKITLCSRALIVGVAWLNRGTLTIRTDSPDYGTNVWWVPGLAKKTSPAHRPLRLLIEQLLKSYSKTGNTRNCGLK